MSRALLVGIMPLLMLALACGRAAQEPPRADQQRVAEAVVEQPVVAGETTPGEAETGSDETGTSETQTDTQTPKQDRPPPPNMGGSVYEGPSWLADLHLARRRGASLIMRSDNQAMVDLAGGILREHAGRSCRPTRAPADSVAFSSEPSVRPGSSVQLVSEHGVSEAVVKAVTARCYLERGRDIEIEFIEATLEPKGRVGDVALVLTGPLPNSEAVLALPQDFALPDLSHDELERKVLSQLEAMVIAERKSSDGSPPPKYRLPERLPRRFVPCRLPGGIVGAFAVNHDMTDAFFRKFGSRVYYSALHFVDAAGQVHLFFPHFVTEEHDHADRMVAPHIELLFTVDVDGDGYDEIAYRLRDPREGGQALELSSLAYWSVADQRWGGTDFLEQHDRK